MASAPCTHPGTGSPSLPRRIAHLDMDAFFASVELLDHPELRGLPVVVGGRRPVAPASGQGYARLKHYVGRGVATTATYEARGIDEIYLDLTEVTGESLVLAQRLKEAVRQATGLTCSIGITPNKLLSKLASELQKPNGVTVLTLEDIPTRIWPLPCSAINGIGPKATARLGTFHLHTIRELAKADPVWLVEHFGRSYGAWLHEAAHGWDDRPLVVSREPKSISRETTFERDLHAKQDREALSRILLDLCERLAQDLVRKGYLAQCVGIKLRFEDFSTITRDQTLSLPIADAADLREAARASLKRVTLDRKLRLLGVRAGSLVKQDDPSLQPTIPDESMEQGLFTGLE